MFKILLLCSLFLSGFSVQGMPFMPFYRGPEYYDAMKRLPHPLEKTSVGYILTLSDKGFTTQLNLKDHVREVSENPHSLILINNQLSSLPDEIATFATLEVLEISGNKFTEVPGVIWALKSLMSLSLSRNQITTISKEIAMLENLGGLFIQDNPITELPRSLERLTKLKEMSISESLRYDPILPLIPNLKILWVYPQGASRGFTMLAGQDLKDHLASITGRSTKRAE